MLALFCPAASVNSSLNEIVYFPGSDAVENLILNESVPIFSISLISAVLSAFSLFGVTVIFSFVIVFVLIS